MTSISSYFNPFSNQHHAVKEFSDLKAGQKAVTVALTILSSVPSILTLGLGSVATFRALTHKYSAINLKNKNKAVPPSTNKVNQQNPFLKNASNLVFPAALEEEFIKFKQMASTTSLDPQTQSAEFIAHLLLQLDETKGSIQEIVNYYDVGRDNRTTLPNLKYAIEKSTELTQQQKTDAMAKLNLLKTSPMEIYEETVFSLNNSDILKINLLNPENHIFEFLCKILEKLPGYELTEDTKNPELIAALLLQSNGTVDDTQKIVRHYKLIDNEPEFNLLKLKEAINKSTNLNKKQKNEALAKIDVLQKNQVERYRAGVFETNNPDMFRLQISKPTNHSFEFLNQLLDRLPNYELEYDTKNVELIAALLIRTNKEDEIQQIISHYKLENKEATHSDLIYAVKTSKELTQEQKEKVIAKINSSN